VANTLLNIGMITQEAYRILVNNLVFTKKVKRNYDSKFGESGAKIGDTINIRLPIASSQTSGQGLQLQDTQERSIPLTLTTQYQRAFAFSSTDLKLRVDDFADRFMTPHILSMANQVDNDGMAQFTNVYNEVGTPGTIPNSTATYLAALQRLDEEAAPQDDRVLIISPAMNATIVGALTGLFNPQITVSKQFKKGLMAEDTLGFDWYKSQNVRNQTVGPLGGTPTVNATAGQTGSSLVTTGWTAAAALRLNVGDVFTIGSGATGVFAVNPQSLQSTGALRQFTVTAPFSSDGSGNGAISISPAIITVGPLQNVVAAPAALATINVNGAANTTSPRGLGFHKDAFAFACADLDLPNGVDMKDRKSDKQLGLSIRAIRDYDINTDRWPLRLDFLGGWATIYPQLAVRVAS
jgi:hypothetical protein